MRLTESVLITRESGGTGFGRIFSGERVLLVAVGEVEAGVDLANMGEEDVQIDDDRVTIRLPEPEILSTSFCPLASTRTRPPSTTATSDP